MCTMQTADLVVGAIRCVSWHAADLIPASLHGTSLSLLHAVSKLIAFICGRAPQAPFRT